MLTTVLSKIGLPILIEFVAKALGRIDHPVAQNAGKALEEVEGALAGGLISSDQIVEANRHAEEMARISMQQYESSLSEINQSLRAEIISQESYAPDFWLHHGLFMGSTNDSSCLYHCF